MMTHGAASPFKEMTMYDLLPEMKNRAVGSYSDDALVTRVKLIMYATAIIFAGIGAAVVLIVQRLS